MMPELVGQIVVRVDNGIRMLSNGEQLALLCETQSRHLDSMEMVKAYWGDVGVRLEVKQEANSLINERRNANEWDVQTIYYCPGGMDAILDPRAYLPASGGARHMYPYYQWYSSGGQCGMERPAIVKSQLDLYDQILGTPDAEEQNELMKQILEISAENFWVPGISRIPTGYLITKTNFRNVVEPEWSAWTYPNPAPINLFQCFWDD